MMRIYEPLTNGNIKVKEDGRIVRILGKSKKKAFLGRWNARQMKMFDREVKELRLYSTVRVVEPSGFDTPAKVEIII